MHLSQLLQVLLHRNKPALRTPQLDASIVKVVSAINMTPRNIDLDEANVRILVEVRQNVFVDGLDRRLGGEVHRTPERVLAGVRILLLAGHTQPALRLSATGLPIVDYEAVIEPLLFQIAAKQVHHMQNPKIHAFQCLRPTLVQNRLRN